MRKLLKKVKNSIKSNIAITSNHKYVAYLRQKGFNIGENCQFFARKSLYFDMTRPFLITLGNNVILTKGVTILTHGYDWAVIKNVFKKVIGSAKPVNIGNNVFIGVNAIILPGATIEDNVVIGSGAVVSGLVQSNSIYAGNPAKRIMSLETYHKKREEKVLDEVIIMTKIYIDKYILKSFPKWHFNLINLFKTIII